MSKKRSTRTPSFTFKNINLLNSKRSQTILSFGMIFSIILIVIFITFAFYAISKFLSIQKSVEIGKFTNDFQSDVDKIWKGSQGSQAMEYNLPISIEKVCFIDYSSENSGTNVKIYNELRQLHYENENMFFYPLGSGEGLDAKEIKNIDLARITGGENPFCVENMKGKVRLTIKKNFGESLVTITN